MCVQQYQRERNQHLEREQGKWYMEWVGERKRKEEIYAIYILMFIWFNAIYTLINHTNEYVNKNANGVRILVG